MFIKAIVNFRVILRIRKRGINPDQQNQQAVSPAGNSHHSPVSKVAVALKRDLLPAGIFDDPHEARTAGASNIEEICFRRAGTKRRSPSRRCRSSSASASVNESTNALLA